jgi:hypothetical protein
MYLRIKVLYQHTLWTDEFWQLDQMKGSFLEMIRGLPKNEYNSYLSGDYYLIYPFFKIFSYNKWGLAIPHIISTLLGFYLLYLVCKRYFKSSWAYLITFAIVCFNATLIHHATEIRVYAILPTLALGTFYLLQRMADVNFRLSRPKAIFSSIFFIIVIWFHVYGILIVTSCLLFAVLSKFRKSDFIDCLKNAAPFTAVTLGLAMPLWLYSVFGPHMTAYVREINPFDYIPSPTHNKFVFLKGVICNMIGLKLFYVLFIGVITPFVFYYKDKYKQLLFLFINIILPIIFIYLIDLAGQYWFLQRQFIWVMPLFAFFLGWVWDSLFIMLNKRTIVLKS